MFVVKKEEIYCIESKVDRIMDIHTREVKYCCREQIPIKVDNRCQYTFTLPEELKDYKLVDVELGAYLLGEYVTIDGFMRKKEKKDNKIEFWVYNYSHYFTDEDYKKFTIEVKLEYKKVKKNVSGRKKIPYIKKESIFIEYESGEHRWQVKKK